MAHLTWYDPRRGAQQIEREGEILVGRQTGCDVLLASGRASRRHARFLSQDGTWWVEDLGSTHGTRVNGEAIVRRELVDGDRIEVGDVLLLFTTAGPADVTPSRMLTERSLSEVGLLQSPGPRGEPRDEGVPLEELVRFGDELRRCTTPVAVAEAMLERALALTGAKRGVVARTDRNGEEVMASAGEDQVRPSRTLVERVLQDQLGLVVVDTEADSQLAGAESVRVQRIRSIACVPMWDGARMVGYAYLDAQVMAFGFRDLDLLIVMAHHAATEIARLELAERVRREEERRRRLLRFLPESVSSMLGVEGLDEAFTNPAERQLSMVHVETTGLTELSGRTSAAQLQRFLAAHAELLARIAVDQHGGTLHRITFSGLRLAFGTPVAREVSEDARSALRAALAMRDAVESLRDADAAYTAVRLHIGVHAGLAVAGMMGPERRLEYSLVGAAVEETARVTLACPPGRVLATSEVLEAAPAGTFEVVPAPERRVQLAAGEARCWWVVRETS